MDKPKDLPELERQAQKAMMQGDWRKEMAVKMDIENVRKANAS